MTQGFIYGSSSAVAGGADTDIQYNNSGILDGDSSFTTDGSGNVTAVSVAFSDNTAGILGTTTNDDAGSGYVGEIIESTVLVGSAVAMVSNTAKTITSISLTAGDWDVWGNVCLNPAGGTVIQAIEAAINTTTDASPTPPNGGAVSNISGLSTTSTISIASGVMRLSLSGTTTVYLIGQSAFTVSTMTGFGYIGARRVR